MTQTRKKHIASSKAEVRPRAEVALAVLQGADVVVGKRATTAQEPERRCSQNLDVVS